jgi:hypothetical protein
MTRKEDTAGDKGHYANSEDNELTFPQQHKSTYTQRLGACEMLA